MNNQIINSDKAYIIGFILAFLSLFLAYLWSPDYLEFVSNGYNYFYFIGFGTILLIMIWTIDKFALGRQDA